MTTLTDLLGRKGVEVLKRNVHINAKDARNNFSEIMHVTDFKERRIVITHRGKPKMALVPIRYLEMLEMLDRRGAERGERSHVPIVDTERPQSSQPDLQNRTAATLDVGGKHGPSRRRGGIQGRKTHAA